MKTITNRTNENEMLNAANELAEFIESVAKAARLNGARMSAAELNMAIRKAKSGFARATELNMDSTADSYKAEFMAYMEAAFDRDLDVKVKDPHGQPLR